MGIYIIQNIKSLLNKIVEMILFIIMMNFSLMICTLYYINFLFIIYLFVRYFYLIKIIS